MLDWHSCQICYPLEIKILLLLQTESSITQDNCSASLGKPRDAEQLRS